MVQGHCGKRQGTLGSCYRYTHPLNIKPQRPLHHFSPGALGRCRVLAPATGSGRFVAPTGSDVILATHVSASFISAAKATALAHKPRCGPRMQRRDVPG